MCILLFMKIPRVLAEMVSQIEWLCSLGTAGKNNLCTKILVQDWDSLEHGLNDVDCPGKEIWEKERNEPNIIYIDMFPTRVFTPGGKGLCGKALLLMGDMVSGTLFYKFENRIVPIWFNDNQRVDEQSSMLESGNLALIGKMMYHSTQ